MKKNIFYVLLFSFFGLISAKIALAVCPVCTIAVGAGVGFSRWLGVDDLITGLWVGALIVSMIIWTINWFDKKNIKFKARVIIIVLSYYILVIVPLYYSGIIGHLNSVFLIFDKLSIGIIVGSLVFLAVSWWYLYLKKRNGDHAYFPFQKVVMPFLALLFCSLIFYLLVK